MESSKSFVESFTLPPLMKEELSVISRTGYYSSNSEFIRDAIRNFLALRKDIRTAIAVELYKSDKISLGRAAEIADVSFEEIKRVLTERNIKLKRSSESLTNIKKSAKRLKKLVE